MAGEKTVNATVRNGVCWTCWGPTEMWSRDADTVLVMSTSCLGTGQGGCKVPVSACSSKLSCMFFGCCLNAKVSLQSNTCVFAFIEPSACLQLASSHTFPPTSASETNPKILPRSLPTVSMSLPSCQDNSLC